MREGRELVTLKDVCSKGSSNITQRSIADNEGQYSIYGASGLIKKVDFYQQERPYIGIVKDGSGYGRIMKLEAKSSVIGTLQYLIPNEDIDINYFYYFLLGIDFRKYVQGAAIPHIYFKDYKDESFLKLPLSEQKQIVAILDKAFAAIGQAQANIERNIENAKELFQSKLNAIFSQKGEGWEEKSLGEVTTKIGSGATPRGGQKSYKEEGISLIRSLNVYDDGFRPEKLAFIDDEQAEKLDNVTIKKGDVLLNITGASVARCCIAPTDYLPARVNQHVSIIRIENQTILPDFLHFSLIAKENKDKLLGIGDQGATRQAITKTQIQKFKITYPKSIEIQEQIVGTIIRLKTKTEAIESHYQQKLANLEDLKKSILQKAFSGELTQKPMETSI